MLPQPQRPKRKQVKLLLKIYHNLKTVSIPMVITEMRFQSMKGLISKMTRQESAAPDGGHEQLQPDGE